MKTLTDILINAATHTPARRIVFAQRDGRDQGYGYAELYARARRALAWLQAAGARPGQRVVVQCQSAQRQIELFWACVLGGMVPVLLPKVASWRRDSDAARKLAGVLRVLDGPLLLVDADQETVYRTGEARPLADGCRWLVDDPAAGNLDAAAARIHEAREDDLAYLQFSSGSTGQPKGVRLTHGNLFCNVKEISDTVKALQEESTLSWMPYYHDMGLIAFHLVPLYRGMGQVKLDAAEFIAEPLFWLRQIAKYHAEVVSSPNFGLQHVLDRVSQADLAGLDLSGVRLLCNGAEPISADVMRRFCALLAPAGFRRAAMFPVYGLAEACVAVTFSPVGSEPRVHRLDRGLLTAEGRAVSLAAADECAEYVEYVDVGYPLPAVELRIAGKRGGILPDGRVGEVQIRGANVTAGYEGGAGVNDGLFTADGWLRTGDLGFLKAGRLTIAGRLKDVIFLNGRNVMAADVERMLGERFALKEGSVAVCAAAVAEAAPQQSGRERIAIFIATRRKAGFQPWAQEIRQAAEDYLGHPVDCVLALPRLPRTSSGKLQRYRLARDWAAGVYDAQSQAAGQSTGKQAGSVENHDAAADETTAEALRRIWAGVLGCAVDEIGLDMPFTALGGTSVKAVEMLARVEEHCGRVLGYPLLIECRTIRDVLAYLARQANPAAPAPVPFSDPATVPTPAASQARIAIIGLAGRFPGGADLEEFWATLRDGRCAVAPVPAGRWQSAQGDYAMGALPQIDAFAADFFGIAAEEARIMDPQQRLMLEVAYAALEDAGYAGQRLDAQRAVGVYLGVSSNSYLEEIQLRRASQGEGADAAQLRHPLLMPANLLNLIAARIAHSLNLKGPALAIDTACSSSLVALQQACNDLLLGNCDLALAGGVNLLPTASAHELLAQAGALSADGICRAFDAEANGMVPGEGLGLVVLKPLARALADGDRIEAVIDAVAVNNDGRSIGIMAPTPEGQEAVLRRAYQRAGVAPAQVGYVEAHGTGTPIGDPIEVRALARVFAEAGRGSCAIGSVKTNIGHLLAAAGIAGLIKVLLALRHEMLPPSLHLRTPHPRVRFERTPFHPLTALQPWPRGTAPRYAAVSSFGFGGTNAHLVLHDLPAAALAPAPAQGGSWLLTLSARNAAELARMRAELAAHLRRHPELRLLDVCYSRAAGRAEFAQRVCYRVDTLAEAVEKLTRADDAEAPDAADELAARWLAGASIDWQALYQDSGAQIVALPAYPFTRGHYWLPPRQPTPPAAGQSALVGKAAEAGMALPAAHLSAAVSSPSSWRGEMAPSELTALIETTLQAIGVPVGDGRQSFAVLGMDSMLALKASNLLQDSLGFALSPTLLFEQDTVERLAAFLAAEVAAHAVAASMPALPAAEHYALSHAQQRLWFLERLQEPAGNPAAEGEVGEPGTALALYNVPSAVRLRGPLDPARLERVFNEIVRRHETLRTTFIAVAGEPRQVIAEALPLRLPLCDLSHLAAGQREAEVQALARADARRPFDLASGPLLRATLLRLGEREHVLLLNMHHIISDGWSLRVLVQEVAALYAACGAGQPVSLPALPVQYKDYADWQRRQLAGRFLDSQLDYWLARLRGAPALLALPTDRPRPPLQAHRGARLPFRLDRRLAASLQELAHRSGATLFMVLLAAFQSLLARYSGQRDICVGTPVANRNRREIEGLIGFFVNILVMRNDLAPGQTFVELLAQVRETALGAFAHQDLPFEQLVEALQPERNLGHSPVFQVLFVLQTLPPQALAALDLAFEPIEVDPGVAQFDLSLSMRQESDPADGMTAFFEYDSDLFDAASMQRMAAHFVRLLEEIVARPQASLAEHALLSDDERRLMRETWNATQADYPADKSFAQLFEAWVARQPQALAVSFGEASLSYAELDARANQLARHLRASSPALGPDGIVAICLERGLEMAVALLGVLKAGAAYLPVDADYPAERIAWMLDDAQPCLLITQRQLRAALPPHPVAVVEIDTDWPRIAAQATSRLPAEEVAPGPDHLAYVIYTSGSTGRPKGVLLPHRGLCNLASWQGQFFGVGQASRVLQFASFGFDACTWEFAMALGNGASLHLAPREQLLPGAPLGEFIRRRAITHATLPPVAVGAWTEVDAAALPSLQTLVVAGEVCPLALARRWARRVDFYNAYGPTETTVCASIHRCAAAEVEGLPSVPIGKPIANTQIHILDERLQPVPIGVAGEIHIGGVGVARGYLNRPELTAERFIAAPFGDEAGTRLYKTGDLGRWRADGSIEYLARNDQQIKLRGYRIELGEIEARLGEHPQVRDAAVLLREDGPGVDEKRLVAYLTARDQHALDIAELKRHLRGLLPEYMLPGAFVLLDDFPLTASGKLDRQALPAPSQAQRIDPVREYAAPQGELEARIAAIWQEILGIEPPARVGRHDNFFDLGGHSLLIVRVLEGLRQAGFSAHVRTLFEHPTPAGLATALAGGAGGENAQLQSQPQFSVPANRIPPGCAAITPEMLPLVELSQERIDQLVATLPGGAVNVQDIHPLAPLQEGILFHHLLAGAGKAGDAGDAYILPVLLAADGAAQRDAFLAALAAIIQRHDVLRTAILWEGLAQAVQVVQRRVELPVEEIALDPARDALAQMQARMAPQHQRMDLRRAPLLHVQTARDGQSGRHYLLLQLHHIISDHVSLEIVLHEVLATLAGQAAQLPEPLPYRNFVAQALALEAQGQGKAAEAYFRSRLADVDEPTAPFGLLDVHGDGSRIEEARQPLDPQLSRRLRQAARRLRLGAASLFHAAFGLLLARTSGASHGDVVFGSVLSGRLQNAQGAGQALGMFINTLPLRLQLQGLSVRQAVEHTQRELVELLQYEQTPLALAQRASGLPAATPLFSAMLNYRHSESGAGTRLFGGSGIEILASQERTNYPFTVNVDDLGERDGFVLTAQTDRRVQPARINAYLQTALESLIEALEQTPERPVAELGILPAAERAQLLDGFGRIGSGFAQNRLIHSAFEEHAERQPEAVAVSCQGQHLTYGELNRRANQLAHHLIAKGIGPERLVAICVDRSLEMIVGLLAILKAGGAYLPIDPGHPAERIAHVLDDAAPALILSQHGLRERLPAGSGRIVALDADWPTIRQQPACNPDPRRIGIALDSLAYVIYTSGSTGQPKGVMIEHRNVTRLFDASAGCFHFDEQDVWTLFHSVAFDFSVWEIWGALGHGGRLLIVPQETTRDPAAFYRLLCDERVSVLNQTPGAFRQLIAAQGQCAVEDREHALRCVIFGGEALDPHSLRPWVARNDPERTRLINMYGITETTVHVTCLPLTRADINEDDGDKTGQGSPIGVALLDLQVCLLDPDLQPVPVGVPGEIHVGGAGLARGYLNRAELTAERFIVHPFAGEAGARLYKSGDLARWREDGTLEYLGRNDQQVKIRGYRIELGEIEAQIKRILHTASEASPSPSPAEVVVIAREDRPGNKSLVAYLGCRTGDADVEALRQRLRGVLPDYMLPSAYVVLERLPLTANGKLDVKALPAPAFDGRAGGGPDDEEPRNATERQLAAIWQAVLQLDNAVGRHDSFFDLGGHSLLIVQLLERLRQAGLVVEARSIFAWPTPAALAAAIAAGQAGPFQASLPASVPPNLIPPQCKAITPEMLPLVRLSQEEIDRVLRTVPGGAANVQDIYPLAPLQEGILFHHQMMTQGDTYILPTLLRIATPAQCEAFLAALQRVVNRHDVLRSSIVWRDLERPVQVVQRHVELPVERFTLDARRDVLAQLDERIAPRRLRIDLQRAPLLRVHLAQEGQACHLVLLLHHIVSDHVSMEILVAEVFALLQAGGDEAAAQLPAPLAYRDFVAQALAQRNQDAAEAFFRARLADVDEPTAPFGLLDVHGDGSQLEALRVELDPALAEALRQAARRHRVGVAALFHTAWALLLAHCSGRDDVVFGSVLSGRLQGMAGADRMLGMFINTLPLRCRLAEAGVAAALEGMQRELVELLRYEQTPLALAQRTSGLPASTPLFSAVLNFRHGALGEPPADSGIELIASHERTNYPLTLSVDDLADLGKGFALTAHVEPRIGAARILGYLRTALQALLRGLAETPEQPLLALSILPAAERQRLLDEFNATAIDVPPLREDGNDIQQAIAAQARKTPQAIAVVHEGRQLSYAELDQRATRLAHLLRGLGVGPNRLVGICCERGLDMVVGLLATLKAGGAYLPLDPAYPAERLAFMLANAAPVVLLTQAGLLPRLPVEAQANAALRVLCFDRDSDQAEIARQPATPLSDEAMFTSRPDDLFYLIYTSGSSGQPKGAKVSRRGFGNLMRWYLREFAFTAADRILLISSFSFDLTQKNIYAALMAGGQLHLPREGYEPQHFVELIEHHGITSVNCAPSAFHPLLQVPGKTRLASLRQVIFGGEAIRLQELRPWLAGLAEAAPQIHNAYGPTECTSVASHYRWQPDAVADMAADTLPIGRPIDNVRLYVLDARRQPVPVGVSGEIWIGGSGVGLGYHQRPELTAERFLDDPYHDAPGARMYRSGDLGRWTADGLLEYLGRNDQQVKIRGFRVELGEIEAQLLRHPMIRAAAVVVRETSPADRQLVAYLACEEQAALDVESLRDELRTKLPDHMLPGAIVRLARLPLTPNGKLDRRALPAPTRDNQPLRTQERAAPQGEMEAFVAGIWQDILHVPQVARDDNFFDLGGHSLLAAQVVARIRQLLGRELPVRAIFEAPELQAFARRLAGAADSDDLPLAAAERSRPLPLSWPQQRLWFIEQFERDGQGAQGNSAYHIRGALHLAGRLDRQALQAALDGIGRRHESLRTAFLAVDGLATQMITAAADWPGFPLDVVDLSALPAAQHADEAERRLARMAGAPFDLTQAPLARGLLLRLTEDEHILGICMHHIIADGWSMSILTREFAALYGAGTGDGRQNMLPELPIQYADYAVWQRRWLSGERLRQQLDYWRAQLAGAPLLLELPTDHARPARQSHAGASLPFSLGRESAAGLRALARRHALTPFMALYAGWALLLARLAGQDEVVIGVPLANRRHAETEGLIGCFVNTLPLRLPLAWNATLGDLLAMVKARVLDAYAHQDLPFEQIVEAVQPPRSLSHSPLFQVMFALQNTPSSDFELPGLTLRRQPIAQTAAHFDLTLILQEVGDDIVGELEYATDLFERATIERWIGHLRTLLDAMAAEENVTLPIGHLPLLDARQREAIVEGFNATATDFPRELCFHQLFEAHAQQTPEALAVDFEGEQLSHAELNERANRLAHHLRTLGVGPDVLVAVCIERSLELAVALLGIFKAGGAYVPVDPSYPAARIAGMLADAAPCVILTQTALRPLLQAAGARGELLALDGDWPRIARHDPDNLQPAALGLTPKHLAYVIYTSGSTGQPKGVMLAHRGLVSLAAAHVDMLALGPDSRVLQFASASFDACTWEFAMAWASGASLHLARRERLMPGEPLLDYLDSQRITHALLTPAALAALDTAAAASSQSSVRLNGLRVLLAGGEVCTRGLVERWAPGRLMYNAYGPTEATVCVSMQRCDAAEAGDPPVGRPLANARIYLLDARGQPVPIGVAGEIHIGGVGVARGYLNRPELTAERFVADPFAGGADAARMYKTGDLGRWNARGELEYLGRNDQQVKLRGFRIELGEIESQLLRLAGVKEAVAILREDRPAGGRQLVAYLTAQPGQRLDGGALREQLRAQLPDFMLPAAFVVLERLPLTPNGKLDRQALPAPACGAAGADEREYAAPQGETETALAAIWQELLQIERVDRRDDFFALGGHSLLAVQCCSRVRQRLGRELALRELFEQPQLHALARVLQAAAPDAASAGPLQAIERDPGQPLPLSWSQQRLWFIDQLEGADAAASRAYHLAGALRLDGALDRAALQAALDAIVARHEVLRSRFVSVTGEAMQVVDAAAHFALRSVDLGDLPANEREAAARARIADATAAPFDLGYGPLARGLLLRLADDAHILCVVMHHIVADAWSIGILIREFAAFYDICRQGLEPASAPLSPLPLQYADHAVWQRRWLAADSPAMQAQLGYWQRQLAGAPALLELPTDRARPPLQSHVGASLPFSLGGELTARLKALARAHDLTLFMTLYAAWAVVLGRLAGQDDVVVGVPVANRGRAELEGLIGFFVNTLALRVHLPGEQTLGELLAQVKELTLAAYAHQDAPFEQVVEALKPPRSLSHSPIFQTLFALQNAPRGELALPGLKLTPLDLPSDAAQFDLSLMLHETSGGEEAGIAGNLQYASELFDAATMARWLGHFRNVLGAMVAEGGTARPIAQLPLLDEPARWKILEGFNATQVGYAQDQTIHQHIEAQAARQPDAIAVCFGGQTLTYAELNRRANQLAHHLIGLGIQPDSLVAICLERGLEMVVGLLGILKAGGAYVPVDPEYPDERIAGMLEDAAPGVVLTQQSLKHSLPAGRAQIIALDSDWARIAQQPDGNPDPASLGLGVRNLAYVIYTSGSTGKPKGAMNEHRAVVNRLRWMQDAYRLTARDRVLQKTPFSFDVSVWEFFWPLMAGAQLVVARPQGHQDPAYLRQLIEDEGITTLHFVPSMLQAFLDFIERPGMAASACPSLRHVVCSGEELPLALQDRCLAALPQAALHNLYGPTEAAIDVTYWECRLDDRQSRVPIGFPIANTQIYILDAQGQPVPIGVAGEIHIGGIGVARGYLNRPELTAERFVSDPFGGDAGARLYKTGDLGRWRADGAIEYLGRNDQQVKLRGFRIELGEIEAQIARHASVREAAVLAREDIPGAANDKRLVAYVTLKEGEALDVDAVKAQLKTVLPGYMVPSVFVVLDAFPLSPSGKLDRKALPAPAQGGAPAREYAAPRGEVEETLARIWQEVLQLGPDARIGRHDDFFDLGGHSLKATQILLRINEAFGIELPLVNLFQATTVAGLAEMIVPLQLAQFEAADVESALAELDHLSEDELRKLLAEEDD